MICWFLVGAMYSYHIIVFTNHIFNYGTLLCRCLAIKLWNQISNDGRLFQVASLLLLKSCSSLVVASGNLGNVIHHRLPFFWPTSNTPVMHFFTVGCGLNVSSHTSRIENDPAGADTLAPVLLPVGTVQSSRSQCPATIGSVQYKTNHADQVWKQVSPCEGPGISPSTALGVCVSSQRYHPVVSHLVCLSCWFVRSVKNAGCDLNGPVEWKRRGVLLVNVWKCQQDGLIVKRYSCYE